MPTTAGKSIGTVLSTLGSENPSTLAKSAQVPDRAKERDLSSTISEDRKAALRQIIAGPVAANTPILTASDAMQKRMWVEWLEALAGYRDDDIRDAFRAAGKRKEFLNPRLIVRIIEEWRAERAAEKARQDRIEAQLAERDREPDRVTAERAQAIIDEVFGAEKKQVPRTNNAAPGGRYPSASETGD